MFVYWYSGCLCEWITIWKKSCQYLHLLLAPELSVFIHFRSIMQGLFPETLFWQFTSWWDGEQRRQSGLSLGVDQLVWGEPTFSPFNISYRLRYRFASCCTTMLAGRGWCVSAQERPCKMLICSTRGWKGSWSRRSGKLRWRLEGVSVLT